MDRTFPGKSGLDLVASHGPAVGTPFGPIHGLKRDALGVAPIANSRELKPYQRMKHAFVVGDRPLGRLDLNVVAWQDIEQVALVQALDL